MQAINGINNPDYEVIFTGHSIGGAVATIASFYYIKKYKFTSENILITFGQLKAGSEHFAKYLTSNLKQIYRITRPKDFLSSLPSTIMDQIAKVIQLFKGLKGIIDLIKNIVAQNYIQVALTIVKFFKDKDEIIQTYSYIFKKTSLEDFNYAHTGGLYMIDDSNYKVYIKILNLK